MKYITAYQRILRDLPEPDLNGGYSEAAMEEYARHNVEHHHRELGAALHDLVLDTNVAVNPANKLFEELFMPVVNKAIELLELPIQWVDNDGSPIEISSVLGRLGVMVERDDEDYREPMITVSAAGLSPEERRRVQVMAEELVQVVKNDRKRRGP